jgi:hypothetical protein
MVVFTRLNLTSWDFLRAAEGLYLFSGAQGMDLRQAEQTFSIHSSNMLCLHSCLLGAQNLWGWQPFSELTCQVKRGSVPGSFM